MRQGRKRLARFALGALAGASAVILAGLVAHGEGLPSDARRADIVLIDVMAGFGSLEEAPVSFPHDQHTEAVGKDDRDCGACHKTDKNGRLVGNFMRIKDGGREEMRDIYHDHCIACHKKTAGRGIRSGPVTCGECHRQKSLVRSDRQPMAMDLSLHNRHIDAMNRRCDACHHEYDEARRVLFYKKGQETSCRDCHRDKTEGNLRSFGAVSHEACLGCHLDLKAEGKKTGPATCAGCHDAGMQQGIARLKNVARLDRGQPDLVLLGAQEGERRQGRLNTVPFDHAGHEATTPTCRACHHQTLQACDQCHGLTSGEGGILLEMAMHDKGSTRSCIGCHDSKKQDARCLGCHGLMEHRSMDDRACLTCHSGPAADDPDIRAKMTPEAIRAMIPEGIEGLTFPAGKIPKTIEIGGIEERYEKVAFPHGVMIDNLKRSIAGGKLAKAFHRTMDRVCRGCHHETPTGVLPPVCGSCHAVKADKEDPSMPDLLRAFHRQCMGCHTAMDVTRLSGCTGCHDKKSGASAAPLER